MSEHYRQAFQAHASPYSSSLSEPVDINTRWDKKTCQHMILWKDIQLAFKNAEYIIDNGAIVPFMTDDDFNE